MCHVPELSGSNPIGENPSEDCQGSSYGDTGQSAGEHSFLEAVQGKVRQMFYSDDVRRPSIIFQVFNSQWRTMGVEFKLEGWGAFLFSVMSILTYPREKKLTEIKKCTSGAASCDLV